MLEGITAHASELAEAAQRRMIERLALRQLPLNVEVERFDGGIRLIGKRLRLRIIKDINFRNFWR